MREPIVDACIGCGKVVDNYCSVYELPSRQHGRLGGCAMRTHNRTRVVETVKFMDPLKESKRLAKGRKAKDGKSKDK